MSRNSNFIFKKLDPFNVAYVEDNKICIEPFLKERKKLLSKIIRHEKTHLPKSNTFLNDYKEDMFSNPLSFSDSWFILRHKPLFWLSPFAFFWANRKLGDIVFEIDNSRLANFIVLLVLVAVFYYMLKIRV